MTIPKQPKPDVTDFGSGGRIDASDVLIVMGLLLLGAGLWWLSPPLALIIVGTVLLLVGLVGAWLRGKRVQP